MGGEKSRHMRTWKLLTLQIKPLFIYLFIYLFHLNLFCVLSLKSRYHKYFYFESFKIRNSVDDQLFRGYLGYYLDDF